ncbi:MAG: hypothetical protein RR144_04705 [Clostridia bacterium]
MRWCKKIVAIFSIACIVGTANCFATILDSETMIIKDEDNYMYRTYLVSEKEEEIFLGSMEKEFEKDNKIYILNNKEKTGGSEIKTINIDTKKKITSNTNNKEKVINILGESIEYNQDGYIGSYQLDKNNIAFESHYNGYKDYLVEETIEYPNLAKNDLAFISKQTKKDGLTLDLLRTDWKVQTTKLIGKQEVPDKYIGVCYYAGKRRIDNPVTYTVTANYYGTAQKKEEKPLIYKLEYKNIKEEKDINYLSIIAGTSGITLIVIACFFIRKNAKVYNLQNGKWVLVGSIFVSKPVIKLDRFSHKQVTNKYKIELSKNAVNKVTGKLVTVKKGKSSLARMINVVNEEYIFELYI